MRIGLTRCQLKARLILNQVPEALRCVTRLLALAPGDSHALATRAHLQATGGDQAAAVQTLRELLAQHPNCAAAWFNLGFLAESLDQLPQAEQAFLRATVLNPKLDRAWYGLALCLIRLRRLDEAVGALHKNTELQPMSPYGWYQLAHVQAKRQHPEAVVTIIRRLRGFEPKVAAQLEREIGVLA